MTALLSVTVPVNGTMRGIFSRRSLRQLCHVVSWPPYTVARELHSQLTEAPPAGEERQRPASLLDALPGAAAVLQSDQARQLLPLWRRCQTQAELEVALLQLRQRRMDAVVAAARPAAPAGEQQAHATSQQQSNAFHWVPEEFELLPASSAQAAELVSQGQVWLLPAGVATAGSQVAATQPQDHQQQQPGAQHDLPAVLVLHGPGVWGMRHAGIVAASRAALDSAVLLTTRLEPRCCWCVGQGDLGWASLHAAGACSHTKQAPPCAPAPAAGRFPRLQQSCSALPTHSAPLPPPPSNQLLCGPL